MILRRSRRHKQKKKRSFAAYRVTKGTFKSFDGTQIYYEVFGSGRPVVFCYGLVCNMLSFRHQLAYFKKKYQCIFFDYRGHARLLNRPPANKGVFQTVARDIRSLMTHLGVQKVSLVGHSMGVNTSFYFAARYPSRVQSLTWINGTLANPFAYMFKNEYSEFGFELIKEAYLNYSQAFAVFWKLFTSFKLLPTLLTVPFGFNVMLSQKRDMENYIHGVMTTPHDTIMAYLIQLSRLNGLDQLKKIQNIPVLICAGANDWITPLKIQEALANQLPQCTFVKVPRGSHNVHLDMPQVVNLKIEKFLKKHA